MAKKSTEQGTVPKFNDRAFILNFTEWPCWPWLPLKRKNNSLEEKNLGVLCADGFKDGFTIYHVYLFGLPRSPEEFKASPQTHYTTVDALLADGWAVD